MKKLVVITASVLLFTSCVSKKKYNQLLQEKAEADDKAYRLSITNSDLTRVSNEMAEDYKTAMKNLEQLEREYASYKKANPEQDLLIIDEEVDGPYISDKETETYSVVEKMPEFPGGIDALMQYLSRKIRYPNKAQDNGVQGRVYVQFVVAKDGSIENVEVIRGIGSGCDEESIRVVKNMPKWTPGEQRGKKVRVKYTLPIRFSLR